MMKKLLNLSFLMIALFATACADPCKNIICNNNGTCEDGTCICIDGFEGVDCDIETREKYLGTYSGQLVCDLSESGVVTMEVSKGTFHNQISWTLYFGTASNYPDIIGIADFTGASIAESRDTTNYYGEQRIVDCNLSFLSNTEMFLSLNLDYTVEDITVAVECFGELSR